MRIVGVLCNSDLKNTIGIEKHSLFTESFKKKSRVANKRVCRALRSRELHKSQYNALAQMYTRKKQNIFNIVGENPTDSCSSN